MPYGQLYATVWSLRKSNQRSLSRDDWARAALAAIGRGGVSGVAVESVAATLGATKGSFYWHFKNRDALIQAALDRWELRGTESVIEELERDSDPAERLRRLLGAALEQGAANRAEIALLATPDHPAAVRAVRRVAERRVAYIADQLEMLGWPSGDARDRAAVLYDIYVGHLHMALVTPRAMTEGERRRRVDLMFKALIAHRSD
jgi:AcrR family transcriptional regulator